MRADLIILLLVFTFNGKAQALEKKRSFRVEAGSGYLMYLGPAGVPDHLPVELDRNSWAHTVRIMFRPEYRLSVGVESGLLRLYSYKIRDDIGGDLHLSAFPLLLVWGLRITSHWTIYGGTGTYFVHSSLDYAGKVNTGSLSIGWMLSTAYERQLSSRLSVGTEIKWYNPAETQDAALTLQAHLIWSLIRW